MTASVDALRARIEVDRIATELGCEPEALAGLEALGPDALGPLRRDLSAGLVGRHDAVFRRVAAASGLLPAPLAASITKRMIGPVLAGRISVAMPERRAAAIAKALDTGFLADTCRTLSPASAARMIPSVPASTVVDVSAELVRRGDHATMGRFVSCVDDPTLTQVVAVLDQPADLLLAGAATDEPEALDRVIALLSPARRAEILESAPAHPDEALSIVVRVSDRSRHLLATAVAELPEPRAVAVLAALTDLISEHDGVRAWALALTGEELAAAARLFDGSDALRSAIGRLSIVALTAPPPTSTAPTNPGAQT